MKIESGRIMLLMKCSACDSKRSRPIKKQEPSGLLSIKQFRSQNSFK